MHTESVTGCHIDETSCHTLRAVQWEGSICAGCGRPYSSHVSGILTKTVGYISRYTELTGWIKLVSERHG